MHVKHVLHAAAPLPPLHGRQLPSAPFPQAPVHAAAVCRVFGQSCGSAKHLGALQARGDTPSERTLSAIQARSGSSCAGRRAGQPRPWQQAPAPVPAPAADGTAFRASSAAPRAFAGDAGSRLLNSMYRVELFYV